MKYRLFVLLLSLSCLSLSKPLLKNKAQLRKVPVGCVVVSCKVSGRGYGFSVIFQDEKMDFLTRTTDPDALKTLYDEAFGYAQKGRQARIEHNWFVTTQQKHCS